MTPRMALVVAVAAVAKAPRIMEAHAVSMVVAVVLVVLQGESAPRDAKDLS
jgi:hypothetical protein